MYENAPDNILNILMSENVTANFHHFCVTETVSDITLAATRNQFRWAQVTNAGATCYKQACQAVWYSATTVENAVF
jgi:hypothetical protein